jgi:hypothetical protein
MADIRHSEAVTEAIKRQMEEEERCANRTWFGLVKLTPPEDCTAAALRRQPR